MKKTLTLVLCAFVALCVSVSACKKVNEGNQWNTVDNNQTKKCLILGMPKLEAEETLNAMEKVDEVSIDSIVTTVYTEDGKDQIKIDYQDNKVTSISVGGRLNQKDQEYSDWFVNGISIGSTKEEVLAVYGTPTQEDILESPQKNEDTGDIYTITYCYDKEGDILEENTGEAEYTVIFFLKGESVVFYSVS